MTALRAWADGIWIAEGPQRFYGFEFGTRMTVIRLGAGDLLVHSPLPIEDALRSEVDAVGPVRHIVSPNKLHHLHLPSAHAAWPEARMYAPPGLAAKRDDIAFDGELGDEPPAAWRGELDQLVVRGSKLMEEVLFLHRASRTLIVADLCEHFGPENQWMTRIMARVARMYERPRMPPDWQMSFRDREARRISFERLFGWDFDRVILAHGALIESGARAIFEHAYAWALA